MNIEQANAIAITEILNTINIKPAWQTQTEAMYLSPIRLERTASFHVNKTKNVWYDFGIAQGGDLVQMVCEYLRYHKMDHNVPDALRWIEFMSGNGPHIRPIELPIEKLPSLTLQSVEPLAHIGLINYLAKRGIPFEIAMNYLKKVCVLNGRTGKTITVLGFENDNGGYELRNELFKGCIGSKYITFIKGEIPEPTGIHIFEGFMDFLTVLVMNNGRKLKDHAIILNSLVCLSKATPYIKDYGYKFAYTWLDNDKAGEIAKRNLSDFFKTQVDIQHRPMNRVYRRHKDVNAWHMHKLSLSL